MQERDTDRLARYIITAAGIAIAVAVCWYFKNVLIYIILAAVLSLVGRPLYLLLMKIPLSPDMSKWKKGGRVHKRIYMPEWLASILTIVIVLGIVLGFFTLIIPVITGVIGDVSEANIANMAQSVSEPLSNLNEKLIKTFPKLGSDFKIEEVVYKQLTGMLDISALSSIVGSLASVLASIGIGLFSMVFIAFFFIRNPRTFTNIVIAFVPDRLEKKVRESLDEIGTLISRYFIGVVLEILGVSAINFLGLYFIAGMGFMYSIGIGFMTGLFNVVPYAGPWIGGALGLVLTLTIKYVCASSFGIPVGFMAFVAIIIGIFVFTQMIDNYVLQPTIYSASIQAHPLEIFIVMLIAGHVGGILFMLVSIPTYTVIRVIAKKFFSNLKPIKMLTS